MTTIEPGDNLRIPDICPEHAHIATQIALIEEKLDRNTKLTEMILLCLQGNGKEGLVTRAALNKSAINRAWWWLGALSAAILGLACWILRTRGL